MTTEVSRVRDDSEDRSFLHRRWDGVQRRWRGLDSGARWALGGYLAILVPLLLWAAALWPAVMVADSRDTWNQAAVGPVIDWHPPAYTYLQRAVYLTVGSPSGVILLQCAAMAYVVGRLSGQVVRFGVRPVVAYGLGVVVALSPPVGAFTAHLIKDVPYTIGFLLMLSVLVEWVADRSVPRERRPRMPAEVLLGLGLLVMLLSRTNATMVVVGSSVALVVVAARRWLTAGVCIGSLAATFAVSAVLWPALDVGPPWDQLRGGLYRFDLSALYQAEPDEVPEEAVEILAYFGTQEEYEEGFNCHWGASSFGDRFWQNSPVSFDELAEPWREAVLDDPLFFVGNHLCAASVAWNPVPSPEELEEFQTVWDVVVPNPQGVVADPWSDRLSDGARRVLLAAGLTNHTDEARGGALVQALLWRPATWMYALAALLVAAALRNRRFVPLWILVPFAAQAASVIAMVGAHYRYMAPAWIGAILLLPAGVALVRRRSADDGPVEVVESETIDSGGPTDASAGG